MGLLSALIAFRYGRHPIAEAVVTALLMLYLGFTVTEEGLRRQAGTYARRLLEAIDALSSKSAPVLQRKPSKRGQRATAS